MEIAMLAGLIMQQLIENTLLHVKEKRKPINS